LLEQALAPEGSEDDPLYLAAMAVEADERLSAKITEWHDRGEVGGRNLYGATRVSQPVAPAAAVRRGDVPESRRNMGLY